MDTIPHLVFVLILLIDSTTQVEGKYCYYSDGDAAQYYYCGTYEYCCSGGCCENFITFYRLWYFWLALALVLLFCSGGGYWYHKHYIQQRVIISQSPPTTAVVTMATANQATQRTNYVRPPEGFVVSRPISDNPPAYNQVVHMPAQYPYSTQTANEGVILNTQAVMYQTSTYGPPPSYDSVSHVPPDQGRPAQPLS